jgi:hypothetical protein
VRAYFTCCRGVIISVIVECGFCDFVIVVRECGGTFLFLSVVKMLQRTIVLKCECYREQR